MLWMPFVFSLSQATDYSKELFLRLRSVNDAWDRCFGYSEGIKQCAQKAAEVACTQQSFANRIMCNCVRKEQHSTGSTSHNRQHKSACQVTHDMECPFQGKAWAYIYIEVAPEGRFRALHGMLRTAGSYSSLAVPNSDSRRPTIAAQLTLRAASASPNLKTVHAHSCNQFPITYHDISCAQVERFRWQICHNQRSPFQMFTRTLILERPLTSRGRHVYLCTEADISD